METDENTVTGMSPTTIPIPEMVVAEDGVVTLIPGILRATVKRAHTGIELRFEVFVFWEWVLIGAVNMNRGCMSAKLPPSVSYFHRVQLGVELNVRRCEVAVVGDIWIRGIVDQKIRIAVQYAPPFPMKRPAWNDVKVTPDHIRKDFSRAKFAENVPGVSSTASDPVIQAALESLLFLTGADEFLRENITLARNLVKESETAEQSRIKSVLLALGVQISGGIVVGGGASFGIYMTDEGVFGTYGTFQVDFGLVASIAAHGVGTIVWGREGATALKRFKGEAFVATVAAGEGISAALSMYMDRRRSNGAWELCGLGIGLGLGCGLPVEFYFSNSMTYVSYDPRPDMEGVEAPAYVDLLLSSKEMAMPALLPAAAE